VAGPIRIAILADGKKARGEFNDTANAGSKLGSSLGKLKAPAIAVGVGIAALGKGLLGLAKGASEDDAAQKILAKTLKNTTGATDAQVASIEDYIARTGVATGITDDEMRPALAKLVAATKDVGKAQGLMGLAMDVSAGTGKDLGTVTAALAKAQNGSVGGLAKLGIATKDASGKTKSFAQIQKDLAKTFAGQSATAADSTAGKYKRFQLVMDELGETIGGGVLPVLGAIAGFMLSKVFPAAAKLSGLFESKVVPKLREFGGFVRSQVVPVIVQLAQKIANGVVPVVRNLVAAFLPLARDAGPKVVAVAKLLGNALGEMGKFITGTVLPGLAKFTGFLRDNSTLVGAVAVGIGAMVLAFKAYQGVLLIISAATKAYAAVQAALNLVMALNPIGIVVLAIVGLIAALVYAYKTSDKFRAIVDGAFHAVQAAASFAFNWVKKNWPLLLAIVPGPIGLAVLLIVKNFDKIKSVAGTVLSAITSTFGKVISFFQDLPGKVKSAIGNAASTLVQKGKDFIAGIVSGVTGRVSSLTSLVGSLPGKALSALGDVGSLLFDAGAKLISGLANGLTSKLGAIKDAAGKVAGAIKDFFPGSPVKDGPLRSWNNGGAGKRLVGFLTDGLGAKVGATQIAAARLATAVQTGFGDAALRPSVALAGALGGSGAGVPAVNVGDTIVYVTIDGEQLQGRIDNTVRTKNRELKRTVKAG